MYRALYRKWRPLRFSDVVGQTAIVTALRNQIANEHVGHAYLFTGVRGTGKTTCAKIFAKAINCMHPLEGDPCGECEACRGIENGSILDVVEMDAASNNGVDNIRDLRDETAYTPSTCNYKVYIIDEVHMLSTAAFNALLKTLEEPPPHVVFILATTEIQKVPATILSRCQRYDFTRIQPTDLAARAMFVAQEEGLTLTNGAADLIARLADGALRDTLSILDTCAGVTDEITEEVVRRMAGVTDRSYLFHISECIHNGDAITALAELANLRQKSVDLKRLTEELIQHYRNLMLSRLPKGNTLLSGVSPEEEARYLNACQQIAQAESVRAIRTLGTALEKMSRGNDQRIELELAFFALTEPAPSAVSATASYSPAAQVPVATAPAPFASAPVATPAPFISAPVVNTVVATPAVPQPVQTAPPITLTDSEAPPLEVVDLVPPPVAETPFEPPLAPPETPSPATPPQAQRSEAAPNANETLLTAMVGQARPRATATTQTSAIDNTVDYSQLQPFAPWSEVLQGLSKKDPMLYSYVKRSTAYRLNKRVLIDGGKMFRDFIRVNKDSQALVKQLLMDVTGEQLSIGPYEPNATTQSHATAEESLRALEAKGLSVTITDTKTKK